MDVDEPCAASALLLGLPLEMIGRSLAYLDRDTLGSFCSTSQQCLWIGSKITTKLCLDRAPTAFQLSSLVKNFEALRSLTIASTGPLSGFGISSLSKLAHLKTLIIGDVSQLPSPQVLINTLFRMTSLEHLELGFGVPSTFSAPALPNGTAQNDGYNTDARASALNAEYQAHAVISAVDLGDFDMSPLVNLKHLNTLVLRNVPTSWNARQSLVFSSLVDLKYLEITYRAPPANLDFLNPLTSLRTLKLSCTFYSKAKLMFALPVMPALEYLFLSQWSLTSASLAQQRNLAHVEFAAFHWHRADLRIFARMPKLTSLTTTLHALPDAEFLALCFTHLRTLWLREIHPASLVGLHGLPNLINLVIDHPMLNSRTQANGSKLAPVGDLLCSLPALQGISLINTKRIPSCIRKAIFRPGSQIHIVELSGSEGDIHKCIVAAHNAPMHHLSEFSAHVDKVLYTWKQGQSLFIKQAPEYDASFIDQPTL